MAYTTATGLMGISPAAWLPGFAVGTQDVQDLIAQGNAMIAAASGPWYLGMMAGDSGATGILELPPMTGIRCLAVGAVYGGNHDMDWECEVSDETGVLGTFNPPPGANPGAYWSTWEWARPLDGWIQLAVTWDGLIFSSVAQLTAQPVPDQADYIDAQTEHYIPDSRVAANRPITTGLVQHTADAIWQAWRRPLVYWTWLDCNGDLRPAADSTSCIAAAIPFRCRGRQLGVSVQAAGSAAAEVTVRVGDVEATATGFPAAQSAIVRGASTAALPKGYFEGEVSVTVPAAGSLTIYSISVYEVPD